MGGRSPVGDRHRSFDDGSLGRIKSVRDRRGVGGARVEGRGRAVHPAIGQCALSNAACMAASVMTCASVPVFT